MHSGSRAERYAVITLPFIPFSGTGGEALSSTGVVVGGVARADGSVALAEWRAGGLHELGVPPGLPGQGFDRPRVFGINGAGTIVGTVHTSAGDLPSRAFICHHGRLTVLPLAAPDNLGGAAIGINGRGDVVGYDHTRRNTLTGWLWSNGAYSGLPVSGTSTAALGINAGGTIIGNRTLSFTRRLLTGRLRCTGQRGYVLRDGRAEHLNGFVYAINDAGDAVGGSISQGEPMATVFRNGVTTVILNLPSYAVGINSSAEVVGFYQPAGNSPRRLLIWSANSGAFDLTPEGYRSAEAAAINDRGEVLGFGETRSGTRQYILLRPDPDGILVPKALAAPPAAGRTPADRP